MTPSASPKSHRLSRHLLSPRVAEVDNCINVGERVVSSFFADFAEAVQQEFKVKVVSLWNHDPVNRRLLHAESVGTSSVFPNSMDVQSSHSGLSVESKRPVQSVLLVSELGHHKDQHPFQSEELGLTHMSSIPVLNIANRNQVLCVINLLDEKAIDVTVDELDQLGRLFAEHYEDILHETCFRKANLIQREFVTSANRGSIDNLYGILTRRIREYIDCDAVVIWRTNLRGELRLVNMTHESIDLIKTSLESVLDCAKECVDSNRELLRFTNGVESKNPHSVDCNPNNIAIVAIPIRDLRGASLGAVVCLKSPKPQSSRNVAFNYGDIAVCEALGQSFAVFFEMFTAEGERLESLARLGHELKSPVAGMRAALEEIRIGLGNFRFTHDYLSDLESYTKSFSDLLTDFEVGSDLERSLTLNRQWINVVHDLFAPATRAIEEGEVTRRKLPLNRIRRPTLNLAPRMQLDKARMQQVVLNLLQNAVKYADDDASKFLVEVNFSTQGPNFEISVRDYGIGVPAGCEDRIFSLGYRAPNAKRRQATGQGFGLAIARKIVQAHGGELEYRRPSSDIGAEFVIVLPRSVIPST